MDPNMYWASMEGQAMQYSAVSCQMTAVRPVTSWTPTVSSYSNMMTSYQPHPGVGHPPINPMSMQPPPPPGHPAQMQGMMPVHTQLTVQQMHRQNVVSNTEMTSMNSMNTQVSTGHHNTLFIPNQQIRPHPSHMQGAPLIPHPIPPSGTTSSAPPPFSSTPRYPPQPKVRPNIPPLMSVTSSMLEPSPPVTPKSHSRMSVLVPLTPHVEVESSPSSVDSPPIKSPPPKSDRTLHTIASKLKSKTAISSKDRKVGSESDCKSILTASPLKTESLLTTAEGTSKEILDVDFQLQENIYKKYQDLFKENGPMEPTDQKVLTCFIQLSKEERRVVMACGSIKLFLCRSPMFELEEKLIHLNDTLIPESQESNKTRPESTEPEELFALKAYKAGITVGPAKSKIITDLTQRIPGDGQSDPAIDNESDSEDESEEESDSDDSTEDAQSLKIMRKILIQYLKADDHKMHGIRQNLIASMNEFTNNGTEPERLQTMVDLKNSIIAAKSIILCKSRIEEASDIINNFCSKHSNNNVNGITAKMAKMQVRYSEEETDVKSDELEEDSPPLTPNGISSKLNVHCTEFVPRSPTVSFSESKESSQDVSTMTKRIKTTEVTTSTVGLTSTRDAGTLTVANSVTKDTQTDPLVLKERGENEGNTSPTSPGIDEEMFEEVLYRAMMAEERVLHLQKDLNLMRAKSRIQELESTLAPEKAKPSISFIKKEIARIEALFDCNVSAVRDGVKLSDLLPLIMKPLPTCSEKSTRKSSKLVDNNENQIGSECESEASYVTARSDSIASDKKTGEMESDDAKEYQTSAKAIGDVQDNVSNNMPKGVPGNIQNAPNSLPNSVPASPEIIEDQSPTEAPIPTSLPNHLPSQVDQGFPPGQDVQQQSNAAQLMLLKQNVVAMLTQINPMLQTNPMLLEMFANQYIAQHQQQQQSQQLFGSQQFQPQFDMQSAASMLGAAMPGNNMTSNAGLDLNVNMNAQQQFENPKVSSPSPDELKFDSGGAPSRPPGIPLAKNDGVQNDSAGPPGFAPKREMSGVQGAPSTVKGRGRARRSKKNDQSTVGGSSSEFGDDSSSTVSGQANAANNSSVFKFGESASSSEFMFRKNVKRVAMTPRQKTNANNPAPVANAGKRKSDDICKSGGWDVGSVLTTTEDCEEGLERLDEDAVADVQDETNEEYTRKSESPDVGDLPRKMSSSSGVSRKSESSDVFVTPPVGTPEPVVTQQAKEPLDYAGRVRMNSESSRDRKNSESSRDRMNSESSRGRKQSESSVHSRMSESPCGTPPVGVAPAASPLMPKPQVPQEYNRPPSAPLSRMSSTEERGSGEDWEDDAPQFGTAWKLSSFGPTILPSDGGGDKPQKTTTKTTKLSKSQNQKPPRFQAQESHPPPPTTLAAKLQKSAAQKKKQESVAKQTAPVASPKPERKQLPIVASSIQSVPVVLHKTPAKSAVKEKPKPAQQEPPKKVKAEPAKAKEEKSRNEEKQKKQEKSKQPEKPKEKTTMSALDSFEVPVIPKPVAEDDSDWQQVCKKKKKSESSPAPPTKTAAQPDKKSTEIFDKLVQKILAVHTHLTRNDAIDVISEVRQMKGGLNGMKLSHILDAANCVINSKKKNQTEYSGPVLMSDELKVDVDKALYKSQLCQFWLNGHCGKGKECHYAHGKDDLRSSAKYVLCSNFERGDCPHGAKCLFAHGKKELQAPPADAPVRTRKKSGGSTLAEVLSGVSSGVSSGVPQGVASAAALDPFPTLNRLAPVEDFTAGEPCVICCCGIRPGQEERLGCGHLFHQTCIKRWVVGEERTCPTCRSHVLLEEEFPSLG